MQISPDAAEVRDIVRQMLIGLGVDRETLNDLSETLLVDDGKCCARTYRADRFMAMWLIDVGIVQMYDDDGNMVGRANLLTEIEPRRMAA